MPQTAKLFMNGRSQAVRLPREFRFEGKEVAIRRDEKTGEVVLSPVIEKSAEELREDWERFFRFADEAGFPADFMDERDNRPAEERDWFK